MTGGTGFIGSYLRDSLLKNPSYELLCVSRQSKDGFRQCNLGNRYEVESLIKDFNPDTIIHLAGYPKVRTPARYLDHFEANVIPTHHLLNFCPPSCRFIYGSSATVYGNCSSKVYEAYTLSPQSVYGISKLTAENLVRIYKEEGKYTNLRFTAIIGKRARHGIIPDILAKLDNRCDGYLELLGNFPGSTKPLLYWEDAIRAIQMVMDMENPPPILNISNKQNLTVQEIAEEVMDAIGIKKPIKWLGNEANWAGDDNRVDVSNSLAYELGWFPLYTSREAIRKVILGKE